MLTEKAMEGLMNAPAEKRYNSFLNTVTDREEAWFLESPDGFATMEADGYIHILTWPLKEFCIPFLSEGEEPVAMEIHELVEQLETLEEDMRFMVFPTQKDAFVVTPQQLREDLTEYLEQIE